MAITQKLERERERSLNGRSAQFSRTVWDRKMHACKLRDVQHEWLCVWFCLYISMIKQKEQFRTEIKWL